MRSTVDRSGVLTALLGEAGWHRPAPGTSRAPVPLDCRPPTAPASTVVPLPPAAPLKFELEPVLRTRIAVRSYPPDPIELPELAALLAAAAALDTAAWPAETAAGAPLEFYCAAWRVAGLPPGIYRYEAPSLVLAGDLPTGPAAADLVLQREFAAAPLVLTVAGNLCGAVHRHGSAGHRQLLLRAGGAAHAAWLCALRLGLAGTVFAGLLPHVLRERVDADGWRRAPLFAFAVGRG